MTTHKCELLLLVVLAFFIGNHPGRSEEPELIDPSHPFGPLDLRFFHGLGWEMLDGSSYSAHLLFDSDNEPIGVSIQIQSSQAELTRQIRRVGAWPCSFEGLIWTLRDNFGYS